MAPNQKSRELSLERSSEYVEFINKLAAYHQKRGTYFDPEPRVGTKHMNLLRLYKAVTERGGYDVVSDEKLAWRKVGQEFNLGSGNLPAIAFQLKGVYYKYLAAYEISTHWGEEPPPKEILEDLTARGGSLRTRTLSNFVPPSKKEGGNNDFSEASGDDGTPSRERNASEDTPGSVGRATRGLRQQPPQRIIFQPDTGPARQVRNVSTTSHPPQQLQQQAQNVQQQPQVLQTPRGASTSYNPANNLETSSAVTNYEPRSQVPLTLRPVTTPGNSPAEFARRKKIIEEHKTASGKPRLQNKGVILPGSGFDGPNIYVRCLCALRSGIRSEQDYALHHLVKISMERGDKYRFEGFPGLAEGLLEKLLEVSRLFYKVDWKIKYEDDGETSIDTLNALEGTPDILKKISQLPKIPVDDNIQSSEFSDIMLQINEAALTLRNMVMLEENASYISEFTLARDFLVITLNLPNLDSVVELKHYALEIAEQITKYLHLDEKDPLFISLLIQLQSEDRGAVLTALRAISRISMNLEESNLLRGVPIIIIQRILDWILLNDEDLVSICLDFLYQYTAVVENVDPMLSGGHLEPLVNQLVRLLLYDAKSVEYEISMGNDCRVPAPTIIAPVPQELFTELVSMEEPERSSLWLRCLFEEDGMESITQIALWQAYQSCFTDSVHESGIPLLPAAEFIKNVSTTFAEKAAAQVQPGAVQKFIIKGIRYRSVPINRNGEEFRKCYWRSPNEESATQCGQFFMSPQAMYQHILIAHLGAVQGDDGRFDNSGDSKYTCGWDKCQRFSSEPATKLSQIASHIKVHLPPRTSPSRNNLDHSVQPPPTKKHKHSYVVPSKRQKFTYHVTAVDEKLEAAGIPLTAVLVLRNLVRNIPKTETNENTLKSSDGVRWVERLFKPIEPRLFEIMAHNKSLKKKPYTAVTVAIERLTNDDQLKEDEHNLSGILNLVEVISLQTTGPTEAARAIRKKLKYSHVSCQLRTLNLLDGLVQNAGFQCQQTFNDEMLLERLRICATSNLSDPDVKKRCKILFKSWAKDFKNCRGLEEISSLYRQLPRYKLDVNQEEIPIPKESEKNIFQDDDKEIKTSVLPPPLVRHLPMLSRVTRPSWPSGYSLFSSSSSRKEFSKTNDKKNGQSLKSWKIEEQRADSKGKIDVTDIKRRIVEAEIASTSLLNTLKLINREPEQNSADKTAVAQFEDCKAQRQKILHYIQNVEPGKWLEVLLQSNDMLVKTLTTYEQLGRVLNANIDSNDGLGYQKYLENVMPIQEKKTEQITIQQSLPTTEKYHDHFFDQDDKNDPFADRNALEN